MTNQLALDHLCPSCNLIISANEWFDYKTNVYEQYGDVYETYRCPCCGHVFTTRNGEGFGLISYEEIHRQLQPKIKTGDWDLIEVCYLDLAINLRITVYGQEFFILVKDVLDKQTLQISYPELETYVKEIKRGMYLSSEGKEIHPTTEHPGVTLGYCYNRLSSEVLRQLNDQLLTSP